MLAIVLLALQAPISSEPMARQLVAVAPEESLHVSVAGRGATVVFIPGLVGSAYSFRKVIARLPADRYRTIVIEPLGVGSSSRPPKADYSLTAQADRVGAALDTLGVVHALVVAHSLGASVALRLSYRHPERVAALLSLDGGPSEAAATAGFKRALRFVPILKWAGGIGRLRSEMRKGLIAASADPGWVTDEVVEGYTAGTAADLDATLLAYLRMGKAREPERLADHLGEITIPVILLRGAAPHNDGVTAKDIDLFRRTLRSFRIDSVSGSGHHLQEERPDAVADAIAWMGTQVLSGQVALDARLTPDP